MSTTTQYTDFSDLYSGLLRATRNDSTASATISEAKRYINTALFDIHIGFGEKFLWAERHAILNTQPQYTTGTVAIQQGALALTGSGTAWDTAMYLGRNNMNAGGKIRFEGQHEVYTVSSVSADDVAAISSRYLGDTLTAGSYVYFEDEYALASDFLRPIDHHRFSTGHVPIRLMGRRDFRNTVGQNYLLGKPEIATIVDKPFSGDTTPVRKIALSRAPDVAYQIPYDYVTSNLATDSSGTAQTQLSADTDEPIVPLRYRHVIVLQALSQWYREKKDDTRAAEAGAEFNALMQRITQDTEIGEQRATVAPRPAAYRYRARRPYRRGSGRYDIDDRFDRLEDRR